MKKLSSWLFAALMLMPALGAAQEAPDALIKRLSTEMIDRIKDDKAVQSGDLRRISQLVDEIVMPHVDFQRMTALAVGRNWRSATPEQQKQLMTEFRALLLRTYAGALSSVRDQTISMKPYRGGANDTEVIVRTEVVQPRGEPIQLDYRLEKVSSGWKIFDVNVIGVWLVETYRNQFAQEVNARGIDGLIKTLQEKNRAPAEPARKS